MQPNTDLAYLSSQGLNGSLPLRFLLRIEKTATCWIWLAHRTKHGGHGHIYGGRKNGKPFWPGAHVASWLLFKGPIPDGLEVLHNCPGGDNAACVNPDHLWLGTQQQNIVDAGKKRLGVWWSGDYRTGEECRFSKLKQVQVDWIRANYTHTRGQLTYFGKLFGVSPQCIFDVVNHRVWKGTNIPHRSRSLCCGATSQP